MFSAEHCKIIFVALINKKVRERERERKREKERER